MTFFISERIFGGYLQWKACAHLQKISDWTKYVSRKWSENDKFLWLHSYIFILEFFPQKLYTLTFLPIEEFPVDSFCKSRALIPKKYMVEQGRVSNWSEIFKSLWLHSSFFNLEVSGPPHTLSHWAGTNFSKRGNFKTVWSNLV